MMTWAAGKSSDTCFERLCNDGLFPALSLPLKSIPAFAVPLKLVEQLHLRDKEGRSIAELARMGGKEEMAGYLEKIAEGGAAAEEPPVTVA